MFDNSSLTSLGFNDSNFIIEVNGTTTSIAEIAEILGWLVAAFSSPSVQSATCCWPAIYRIPSAVLSSTSDKSCLDFRIDREMSQLDDVVANKNGQCWRDLFQSPVVVFGYPILQRPSPEPGLEMPLNVMAALLDEKRIHLYQKRLYIKGFNALLVATKHVDDLFLWHLLLNRDGSYMPYLKPKSTKAERVDNIAELEAHRHIVGWCSDASYYAGANVNDRHMRALTANVEPGASDANYMIERSRLPKPHSGCILEKCSISGGKFVSAGVSFALGTRDKSLLITREGYIRRLEWISKKFVVFWDEGEKRGWLVNGTSALLHLVRASLAHNSQSKFKSAYSFNPDDLIESKVLHAPSSALDVLLNKENRKLSIYEDDEDLSGDDLTQKQVKDFKAKKYRFQNRVEELFEMIEKILHYETSATEESGVKLNLRTRKYLEGWDFKDLATDNDPFTPRVATLDAYGKGWVDFTRKISAITLFGQGFGEIIKPTAGNSMCSHWTTLPKTKYYLAASLQDLRDIAEFYGNPNTVPMRLCDDMIWHNPAPDQCQCRSARLRCPEKKQNTSKHSELAQVLLPINYLDKKHCRASSFKFLVFGHNRTFPWKWGDHGEPLAASITDVESGVETLLDDQDSEEPESSVPTSIFSRDGSETTKSSQDQVLENPSAVMPREACSPTPDVEEYPIAIKTATIGSSHSLHIHDNTQFIYGMGQTDGK